MVAKLFVIIVLFLVLAAVVSLSKRKDRLKDALFTGVVFLVACGLFTLLGGRALGRVDLVGVAMVITLAVVTPLQWWSTWKKDRKRTA